MNILTGFLQFMFDPVNAPWYTGGVWGNQLQWTIVWLPTMIILYRHHKCHECLRLARHDVKGTYYRTCGKHATEHVHDRLTAHFTHYHPEQHKLLKKPR